MAFSASCCVALILVAASVSCAAAGEIKLDPLFAGAPTSAPPQLLWSINQTWVLSAISSQDGEVVIVYHRPNGMTTANLGCYRASDGSMFWEKTNMTQSGSILLFDRSVHQLFVYMDNHIILMDSRSSGLIYSIPYAPPGSDGPFDGLRPQFTANRIMFNNGTANLTVVDRNTGALLWRHEFTGSTGVPLGDLVNS